MTFTREVFIKHTHTNIQIPYQLSFIDFLDSSLLQHGKQVIQYKEPQFDLENNQKQAHFIDLNYNCVRVAELLNEKLRALLQKYYEKSNTLPKEDLLEKDFSGLRDILSTIIKSDQRFHDIEVLNTSQRRKLFTKTFAYFIEDRNIFTHGQLHVRINDMAVVINYIDKKNHTTASCIVDEQIIQSFFYTYKILSTTLTKMLEIIQSKREIL